MNQTEIQNQYIDKLNNWYISGNKRALANLTMRFGKTKVSIELLRLLVPYHATILISYPDNQLKESWQNELIKWNYDNPNITFVNFSSLWKYEDKVLDFVIADEIHSLSDGELDTLHRIITNDENIYFLGLSGTLSKETKERIGIPIVVEYNSLQAIDDGIISDYKVFIHKVELDNKIKTPNKKGKLLTEKQKYDNYTYVINKFKEEGKKTMHLVLSRNRLSISSIAKKRYVLNLLNKLKHKRCIVFCGLNEVADTLNIPSYHSKSKNDQNFQDFQSGKINHLALSEKGGVGVTYKNLDCVILLNFHGNSESTSQKLHRGIFLDYQDKCSEFHIISLNEPNEQFKLKKALEMLDKNRIEYV